MALRLGFFSPPGRRWPEGSDEGATSRFLSDLAPSSRCRDLLPLGEKKQASVARSINRTAVAQAIARFENRALQNPHYAGKYSPKSEGAPSVRTSPFSIRSSICASTESAAAPCRRLSVLA